MRPISAPEVSENSADKRARDPGRNHAFAERFQYHSWPGCLQQGSSRSSPPTSRRQWYGRRSSKRRRLVSPSVTTFTPAAPSTVAMDPRLSVRDQSECPENWSIVPCTMIGWSKSAVRCRRGAELAMSGLPAERLIDRVVPHCRPLVGGRAVMTSLSLPVISSKCHAATAIITVTVEGPKRPRTVGNGLTAPPPEVHVHRILDAHARRAARWAEGPRTSKDEMAPTVPYGARDQ